MGDLEVFEQLRDAVLAMPRERRRSFARAACDQAAHMVERVQGDSSRQAQQQRQQADAFHALGCAAAALDDAEAAAVRAAELDFLGIVQPPGEGTG